MRKTLIFLSVFLGAPFLARGADVNDVMTLRMKDSTVKHFFLASGPEVSFQGSEVMIWSGQADTRVSVSIEEVEDFTFADSASAGSFEADGVRVSFDDNSLTVSGAREGDEILLFDTNGLMLGRSAAGSAGTASIDISGLRKGVYLVRAAGLDMKMYRR